MINHNKKSQVWVETVIYTVIGLSIIAVIFTVANPQIEKIKDKSIVEQTVNALNSLDNKIAEVEQAPGSTRMIEFAIGKGSLEIDGANDLIKYTLEDTKLELSQVGTPIQQGRIELLTEKTASRYMITLTMKYNLNITNNNLDTDKVLSAGATPYKISIENKDVSVGNPTQIDLNVI